MKLKNALVAVGGAGAELKIATTLQCEPVGGLRHE